MDYYVNVKTNKDSLGSLDKHERIGGPSCPVSQLQPRQSLQSIYVFLMTECNSVK